MLTRSLLLQRPRVCARRALHDVLLTLAALAMFGAQALSTLHFALVPHHLCAEHGVLEDGTASAQPDDHEGTRRAASQQSSEQDDHDTCGVATRSEHGAPRDRLLLGRVTLVETDLASVSAGVLVKLERAALLSRAPKTSPPGRA